MGFLCGLHLNRSIEKMTFYGCDFDPGSIIFDVLISFFISNQAFESLHVIHLVGGLASVLSQFNS